MTRSLSLLQRDSGGDFVQLLSLPHRSGTSVSGPAKLVQHVIAELLTRRGSVRHDRNYGCNLVGQIGITNASSLAEVGHAINVAVSEVQDNMRARSIGNEPLDEILDRIVVEQLRQEQTQVVSVLRIYPRGGESVSYPLALRFDEQ